MDNSAPVFGLTAFPGAGHPPRRGLLEGPAGGGGVSGRLCRVPLAPRSKQPLVVRWQKLPADHPDFAQVFSDEIEGLPKVSVGLRLDGLLVADCDSPERVEWWEKNAPPTDFQSRGRPERRAFWYRLDPDAALRPFKIVDLEIRTGTGQQQVVPPSVHPDTGQPYEWLGPPVDEDHLDELPEAPLDFIRSIRRDRPTVAGDGAGWDLIGDGTRDILLTSMAGMLRRRGASAQAIEAALSAINQELCCPPKPATAVRRIAHSIGRREPTTYSFEVVE